jgi:uncharacterized SAM-binding protein YcdF (DUF218 family)
MALISGIRFRFYGAIFGVLAAAAFWLGWDLFLPLLGDWLDVGQQPRPADYAMVLGGDWGPRSRMAAHLVKAGLARQVLVPRPAGPLGGGSSTTADDNLRQKLLHAGVSASDIENLETPVASTYDEALALVAFLRSRPEVRVTVVTSDYHTRRARWSFSQALAAQQEQVSFVSAPSGPLNPETIRREYCKLGYYWLRHGPLGYGVATGLVLLLSTAASVRFRSRSAMLRRSG